jgi:hypothetical protein
LVAGITTIITALVVALVSAEASASTVDRVGAATTAPHTAGADTIPTGMTTITMRPAATITRGTATAIGATAAIAITDTITGGTVTDVVTADVDRETAAFGSPFRLLDTPLSIVSELQLRGAFGMVRPLDSLSGAIGRSRGER